MHQVQRSLHERQSHFKNFVKELTDDPDFHPRMKQVATDAAILFGGSRLLKYANRPEVRRAMRVATLVATRSKKIARARGIGALRNAKLAKGMSNISGRAAYGSVKILREFAPAMKLKSKTKIIIPRV